MKMYGEKRDNWKYEMLTSQKPWHESALILRGSEFRSWHLIPLLNMPTAPVIRNNSLRNKKLQNVNITVIYPSFFSSTY